MSRIITLAVLVTFLPLAGCGTLTGIPGHGGGKRFAVEQELVAAATRAAIKRIDLTVLRGKKVNLFVNAIGDTGSGNLTEGRFSPVAALRGDTVHTPATTETSTFPRYKTTTTTSSSTDTSGSSSTSEQGGTGEKTDGSGTTTTTTTTTGGSGDSTTTTSSDSTSTGTSTGTSTRTSSTDSSSRSTTSGYSETESTLPMADSKRTQQSGGGYLIQAGVEYKGLGAYHNSEEITSNDLMYLAAIMQTYFYLRGVNVVPPSEAEIDVYVTVDVFGTVRSRVEWFLANNEILRARTSLEVLAIDRASGRLVMPPQSAGAEAEYNEQFVLWAGPIMVRKYMRKAEPILCDFTDLTDETVAQPDLREEKEQAVPLSYPFRSQIERWRADRREK
ncbi:MAG: hypothetical protein BWK76_20695 [Desulfobulbaceae bacterium A2]|nr:MAG: hypothetical protein BWK76_20695 [Desulfobulbaceae bacterium A2]